MTDQTWFVDLDLRLDSPISDDKLDDLIDAVIPLHGAVSAGDSTIGLSLAFEALDAWDASTLARNFVELDLGPIVPVEIASVRILDEATRTAENEEPTFPPVMAVPDIAELLKVTRQQAHRLTNRADFPTPALEPRTGPLWTRAAVESWNEHTDRQAGRPATKKLAAADNTPGIKTDGERNFTTTSVVKKAPSSSQRTKNAPTDSHRNVKNPGSTTRTPTANTPQSADNR